jgi:hypothetical protein
MVSVADAEHPRKRGRGRRVRLDALNQKVAEPKPGGSRSLAADEHLRRSEVVIDGKGKERRRKEGKGTGRTIWLPAMRIRAQNHRGRHRAAADFAGA